MQNSPPEPPSLTAGDNGSIRLADSRLSLRWALADLAYINKLCDYCYNPAFRLWHQAEC